MLNQVFLVGHSRSYAICSTSHVLQLILSSIHFISYISFLLPSHPHYFFPVRALWNISRCLTLYYSQNAIKRIPENAHPTEITGKAKVTYFVMTLSCYLLFFYKYIFWVCETFCFVVQDEQSVCS